MFSVNGVKKSGCRVSGIFQVWIFSRSKTFLVSSSDFLIWLLYAFVSLTFFTATSAPWLEGIQSPFKPPPRTVQDFRSGRGGEDGVWFTRCVDGREPKIHKLWTFVDNGTCEVHLFDRINIGDYFTGEMFHTNFFSVKGRQVALLGQRSVNGSVGWIYVPWLFCDTGVATAALTQNLYVDPWIMTDSPPRSARINRGTDNHVIYSNIATSGWGSNIPSSPD